MGGITEALTFETMEAQSYSLRWNNHKANVIEILDALIKVESYVDCTIIVDHQVQFKAHRVVLAANSPYFQNILQDAAVDHCSIIFPGVKAFEMHALLEYMYTGEVNVTKSQIPKIMLIAEQLEVKGLFDMVDLKDKFKRTYDVGHERPSFYRFSSEITPTVVPIMTPSNTNTGIQQDCNISDNYNTNITRLIPTAVNITPVVPPPVSCSSPPYNSYMLSYSSMYTKTSGTVAPSLQIEPIRSPTAQITYPSTNLPSTSNSTSSSAWPVSPTTAAAAMLSSVYESAADMNPLKRKKLSSISSMLMNRDTPILRNVLAQTNSGDHSQPATLPLTASTSANQTDLNSTPMNLEKAKDNGTNNYTTGQSNQTNQNYNGSDYGGDKKYIEEAHSPYTDRSLEDETYEPKNSSYSSSSSFSNQGNQKPEWKRYKQYTRNDILSAIQCVREGMTALQASRKFGVPSRTLYDKVKKLGISTSRPMNRTAKRSPNSYKPTTSFTYSHAYGGPSTVTSAMHEQHLREDFETKEQQTHHHHLPATITHPAAALLDPAFLQQALESHNNAGAGTITDITGREALHAMALAAAAHAAANGISPNSNTSNPNDHCTGPTNLTMKYDNDSNDGRDAVDNKIDLSQHNRQVDLSTESDEENYVEDLSISKRTPIESPSLPLTDNNSSCETKPNTNFPIHHPSPYPSCSIRSNPNRNLLVSTNLATTNLNENCNSSETMATVVKSEVVLNNTRMD